MQDLAYITEAEHEVVAESSKSTYPDTFRYTISAEQAIADFESRVGEWHELPAHTEAQITLLFSSPLETPQVAW